MKNIYGLFLIFSSIFSSLSQQIGNSDLELWDNVGSSTEEPSNWNSFKSAQGGFTSLPRNKSKGLQQSEREQQVNIVLGFGPNLHSALSQMEI